MCGLGNQHKHKAELSGSGWSDGARRAVGTTLMDDGWLSSYVTVALTGATVTVAVV